MKCQRSLRCISLSITPLHQPLITLHPIIVLQVPSPSPVRLTVLVVTECFMNGDLPALATALLQDRRLRLFPLNTSIPMTLVFTLA